MSKKIAFIYSRLFDPFLILAIIPFLAVTLRGDLTTLQTTKWLLFVFTIGGIIPLGYYLWLLFTHRISGIELKEREERNGIFIVLSLCWLAIYLFSSKIQGPKLVQATYLAGCIITAFYYLVNLKLKISGHSGFLTAFIVYLSILVSPYFLFGLVFVVIMFWARRTLKLHTFRELVLGVLISGGVMLTVLEIFGY